MLKEEQNHEKNLFSQEQPRTGMDGTTPTPSFISNSNLTAEGYFKAREDYYPPTPPSYNVQHPASSQRKEPPNQQNTRVYSVTFLTPQGD